MRKLIIVVAAAVLATGSLSAPAFAQKDGDYQQDGYAQDSDAQLQYDDPDAAYEDEGGPPEPSDGPGDGYADEGEDDYRGEIWRDDQGQVRCRRSDGTTGLIVGGVAGGLIGRGIDTRGERGTGTIIGAIAGALVGRAVEQGARCR